MKERTKIGVGVFVGTLALVGLIERGCNTFWNNRVITAPAYKTVSYATGLVGHVEYTKYADGSEDIKVYPGVLGHRLASSRLYQNLDGDDTIDRIRVNGPEWKMHRLEKIFVRKMDYSNKDLFDKADKFLKEQRTRSHIK